MMNNDSHYDITISGGGPAGSVLGILSARAGLSVLIVERDDFQKHRIGEHLSPNGHGMLCSLQLDHVLKQSSHLKSDKVCSYWGSDQPEFQDYFMNPYGHGWNLDRVAFDHDLLAEAEKCGCDVRKQFQIKTLSYNSCEKIWDITLNNKQGVVHNFQSRWIIDATGRQASIARMLGVKRNKLDKLVGITAHIENENLWDRWQNHLYLETMEEGWWYALKLPQKKIAAVFMSDVDMIQKLFSNNREDTWFDMLRKTTIGHEIPFDSNVSLSTFPAESGRLESFSGEGWLAVGETAVSFDPLSSRGIAFTMQTAVAAAEALAANHENADQDLIAYNRFLEQSYQEYVEQRADVYVSENRWDKSLFWNRRHEHL